MKITVKKTFVLEVTEDETLHLYSVLRSVSKELPEDIYNLVQGLHKTLYCDKSEYPCEEGDDA